MKLHKSSTTGYYFVNLCKDKEYKLYSVHRLVATTFIPNPDNLPIVNHKNEVREDNNVSNLEWCTPNYNIEYSNTRGKLVLKISKPVEQYDIDGNLLATYKSILEAGNSLNVHPSSIGKCCKGKIGSVRGFLWKFKGIDKKAKTRARCRRVIQRDMEGNVIRVWGSIKEAADSTRSSMCGILQCCQGRRNKTSNYFKWEYYDKLPVTAV